MIAALSVLLLAAAAAWWQARSRAQRERAAHERFAADLAHDLRSPLSVITATAMTLREASAPDPGKLDKIVDQTQRITRMLQNRVVAVQIAGDRSAERNVYREWLTLEELVGDALARLGSAVGERAVRVDIPGEVIGHLDPRLCELMICNVLDNAARHTPPKTAIAIRSELGDRKVVIEITDAGPGIAADAPQKPGGGLAVARAIAIAHGGSFETLTRPEGGTCVRISIPDAEPRPTMAPELAEVG